MAEVHLAFAGNMGVGKTEFTQQVLREPNRSLLLSFLKNGSGVKSFQEIPDKRLLSAFYSDSKKWAFASQMYYFALRLNTLRRIQEFPGFAIEDRTIFEDKNVFGKTNFDLGNMHDMEYFVYERMYKEICGNFKPPTLLVYLKITDVSILSKRIQKRGREEEKSVSPEYLQRLNDNYDLLFDKYPYSKLLINAETDMFEHPSYHTMVICEIAKKLKKIGVTQKTDRKPADQSMLLRGADFVY